MPSLSLSEKDFIRSGIRDDLRQDGRKRNDTRAFYIDTGVVPLANGSSRATVHSPSGTTDILVGVKCQIGPVEWTSLSARDEEDAGRGMILKGRRKEQKGGRVICTVAENDELAAILNDVYGGPSSGIDLDALEIVKGLKCWVVHVDVLVLDESGGNVLDLLFLAVRTALLDTRIPHTRPVEIANDTIDAAKNQSTSIKTNPSGIDFEVFDNWSSTTLPWTKDEPLGPPIAITLNVVNGPSTFAFIDASAQEEQVADSCVHVIVSPTGKMVGIEKTGHGSLGTPADLKNWLALAKEKAKEEFEEMSKQ